jgi:hypothetical protein
MLFSELMKNLCGKSRIITALSTYNGEISDVALLDGRQTVFEDSILYFGYSEQLKSPYPRQLVLAGEAVSDFRSDGNLAIASAADLFYIFNEAKKETDSARKPDVYGEILSIGGRYSTFAHGINTAASKMGNPLLLLGADASIFGYSTAIKIRDKFWLDNIARGSCTYDFRRQLADSVQDQDLPDSGDAFIFSCPDSPLRMLVSRIFICGQFAAMSVMLEQEAPIDPLRMEMFPIISAATGEIIARYAPYMLPSENAWQLLLYDMLDGAGTDELEPRIAEQNFPRRMCAIYALQHHSANHKRLRNEISAKLRIALPGVRITYYADGIAALVPMDGDGDGPDRLDLLAEEENLCVGVSTAFCTPEDFPLHFRQARAAVSLSASRRDGRRVCRYGDYVLADLLNAAGKSEDLRLFRHPALEALERYDAENGTEFNPTLKKYLESNCSIKDTAAALYIHRNTMNYRIDRIRELTGTALEDVNTRLWLEISYMIK